jgi:4-amino-4-deoxy-L-arabinose transferase-like glycosyltransferase
MAFDRFMGRDRWIFVVLVVGLALRIAILVLAVWISPNDRTVFYNKDDTLSYLTPAVGLMEHGRFVSKGKPEMLRSPGYPVFLLPGLFLGEVELVTVALQIVVNCLTIIMVYKIVLLLFADRTAAVLSALLYAVDPSTLIQTSIIQTETLFAFTLVLFMLLMLLYLQDRLLIYLLLAGLMSSICVYVKPLAFYMPFVVLGFLLLSALVRKRVNRKLLIHTSVFFVVAIAPVFVWQIRNKVETGSYAFSTIGGKDLYYDAACAVLAQEKGISFHEQKEKMGYFDMEKYFSEHPEQRDWGEAKIVDYQMKEAVKIIVRHPYLYFKNVVYRAALTLTGPGLSDWLYVLNVRFQNIPKILENRLDLLRLLKGSTLTFGLMISLAVLLFAYWFFAAFGLLADRCYTNERVIFLIVLSGYYVFLPAAAGIGYARFRHPIIPVICVLAGKGLSVFYHRRYGRKSISLEERGNTTLKS